MLSILLLPLAILAVLLSGHELQATFGKSYEDVWEGVSVGISVTGVALRMAVLGFYYESGKLPAVDVLGLNRLIRYPVLLSDVLIAAGFALGTQVWWFTLIAVAAVTLSYVRARRAAEMATVDALRELTALYGTVMPLDALLRFDRPRFSLRRGVWLGYTALLLVVAFTVAMEVAHDLHMGEATLTEWPADWKFYFAALALGSAGYLMRRSELRAITGT